MVTVPKTEEALEGPANVAVHATSDSEGGQSESFCSEDDSWSDEAEESAEEEGAEEVAGAEGASTPPSGKPAEACRDGTPRDKGCVLKPKLSEPCPTETSDLLSGAERLEKAEKLKEEANALYKEGDYQEAALTYTQALVSCPESDNQNLRAVLFSNRYACELTAVTTAVAITAVHRPLAAPSLCQPRPFFSTKVLVRFRVLGF